MLVIAEIVSRLRRQGVVHHKSLASLCRLGLQLVLRLGVDWWFGEWGDFPVFHDREFQRPPSAISDVPHWPRGFAQPKRPRKSDIGGLFGHDQRRAHGLHGPSETNTVTQVDRVAGRRKQTGASVLRGPLFAFLNGNKTTILGIPKKKTHPNAQHMHSLRKSLGFFRSHNRRVTTLVSLRSRTEALRLVILRSWRTCPPSPKGRVPLSALTGNDPARMCLEWLPILGIYAGVEEWHIGLGLVQSQTWQN